jgi:hypothetical protein
MLKRIRNAMKRRTFRLAVLSANTCGVIDKTIHRKKLPPQNGAAVVKMNAVEKRHTPEGMNPSTRRIVQ